MGLKSDYLKRIHKEPQHFINGVLKNVAREYKDRIKVRYVVPCTLTREGADDYDPNDKTFSASLDDVLNKAYEVSKERTQVSSRNNDNFGAKMIPVMIVGAVVVLCLAWQIRKNMH